MVEKDGMPYLLRPAVEDDKLDILGWRNQPQVRKAMLTQEEISLETHLSWWDKAMADPTRRLLILEKQGVPMAVELYFDFEPGQIAWWAFYLTDKAPQDMVEMFRLWSYVEIAGLIYAFDHLRINDLLCEIRTDNTVVVRWHQHFGFEKAAQSLSVNTVFHDLIVYKYTRDIFAEKKATSALDSFIDIDFRVDERDIRQVTI